MNEHEKMAKDFLHNTKTTLEITFLGKCANKRWGEDAPRNKFFVQLRRKGLHMQTYFWDSFHNTNKPEIVTPSEYDILSCLEKYDVGYFAEFCDNFNYRREDENAKGIWHECKVQYRDLRMMYNGKEMERLREIC